MELAKNFLNISHFRSRERVKHYGEVFTQEQYVHQMLDLLDKSAWINENIVFFEPTCGHGNFVVAIAQRRLDAFLKKAKKKKIKRPHCYAIANTLNNLWAIDIDRNNIEYCKSRVWNLVLDFFCKQEKINLSEEIFSEEKGFFAHVLCCIQWQIQENEMLSCLEEEKEQAKISASKTMIGQKWFSKHGHRPIDFEFNWCEYFSTLQKNNIQPMEFKRAIHFINALSSRGINQNKSYFNFANPLYKERAA